MKVQENYGLVQRALAAANGGNIHDVRVLVARYRNCVAVTNSGGKVDPWEEKHRLLNIREYEDLLSYVADRGRLPDVQEWEERGGR